jgi:hypothetical protein
MILESMGLYTSVNFGGESVQSMANVTTYRQAEKGRGSWRQEGGGNAVAVRGHANVGGPCPFDIEEE